jgi:ElaA protein
VVTVISRRFDELSAREFHDVLRLRTDVFVVEQACAYPELDGRDTEVGTEHHWIELDGSVACCARTLAETDGSVRIGRVATDRDARGRGLAAEIVRALCDRFGHTAIVLDAQSYLVEWYAVLGFEPCGDEFVEDGIPHVPMQLRRRADITTS